ncbi:protein of unknown function [Xenorhabdus poinarii G6]|uniref:Uncharacterized protein n=1 Tax=Xenorhabdus poinarii G6 TaxID=1354304 RepID=A0A068QYJ6_9GAMM|nr:protein of unknown function [Xenorhabdus poinarii G6]
MKKLIQKTRDKDYDPRLIAFRNTLSLKVFYSGEDFSMTA